MANPFAAAAANPFAAAAAPANPFAPAPAAAPANPFAPAPAAAPANPFAPAPAAAPANPFAPAPAAAPAVNPFAAAAAPAAPAAAPVNPFAPAAAAAPAAPGAAAAAPAAGGAGAASLSAADAATYTDAVLQYDRKTALDQLSLSMTDASADPGLLDAFDAVVELLPRRALTQVYWDPLQPGEQPSIPPLMSVEEYSQLTRQPPIADFVTPPVPATPRILDGFPAMGEMAKRHRLLLAQLLDNAGVLRTKASHVRERAQDAQKRIANLRDAQQRTRTRLIALAAQLETAVTGHLPPTATETTAQAALQQLRSYLEGDSQLRERIDQLCIIRQTRRDAAALASVGGSAAVPHAARQVLDPYDIHEIQKQLRAQKASIDAVAATVAEDVRVLGIMDAKLEEARRLPRDPGYSSGPRGLY